MSGVKGRSGGRNRLPTYIKDGRGTNRRDRSRPNEPKPKVCLPPTPVWLSDEAKVIYARLGRTVVRMRVCTEADGEALALAAVALEDWQEADRRIREDGMILTRSTEHGQVLYRNPAGIVKERAWRNYRDALRSFGLDPQSRAGVAAVTDDDEMDAAEHYFQ